MITTRIILIGVAAVLAGCREDSQPIARAGPAHTTAKFGQSVEEVRRLRPNLRFAPYAGWIEDLPSAGPFEAILYRFAENLPGDNPETGGSLWAVEFGAKASLSALELLASIDTAIGKHEYVGCVSLPPRDGPRELAVVRWKSLDQEVVATVLLQKVGSVQKPIGPLILTLALAGTPIDRLVPLPLQHDCFSVGL